MRKARSVGALLAVGLFAALSAGPGCGSRGPSSDPNLVRIGHFPNVTHAEAVIAHGRTRGGKGWFEERIKGLKVEWYVFNAGPSAMEALLAGTVDLVYVGPSPAVNAYTKARGESVRVVSGVARGGSALVVHEGGGLERPEQFRGKKVATPQLGNTQDVAARAWLTAGGLKVTQTGGDAQVLPTSNPDQLALFKQGDVDAVWTVEPWVSRLEVEAQGKVIVEEKDALTTVLVASDAYLKERPVQATHVLAAHLALMEWILRNPDAARAEMRAELKIETHGIELSEEVSKRAWGRIRVDDEVSLGELEAFVGNAKKAGFLKDAVPLDRLLVTVPVDGR